MNRDIPDFRYDISLSLYEMDPRTLALWRRFRLGQRCPMLVGCQLGPGEDAAIAGDAVVVRVPQGVGAGRRVASLVAGHLAEAGGAHVVLAKVQPPVGNHLVGIGAHIVALATVEVRRLLSRGPRRLCGIWKPKEEFKL